MSSPPTLEFDRLLAPISDDQPAGVELKDDAAASAAYYQVKDAREAARAAERQLLQARWADEGDNAPLPPPPDWRTVIKLAQEVLAKKSKDLWVSAWLIEGLTREEGFAGLRDGFSLVRQLCERFWDDIHPRPDDDGLATTVAQLTGLNGDNAEGALMAPILAIPITDSGKYGQLTGGDYRDSADLQQISDPDARKRRQDQGVVTIEAFQAAVNETPESFYQQLVEDIQEALDQFDQMTAVLEEKCGCGDDGYPLAPPSSSIRGLLVECYDRVKSLARHVFAPSGEDGQEAGMGLDATSGQMVAAGGDAAMAGTAQRMQTREDAFRMLLKVAEFFEHTEPHSPVSYALRQAVRWGKMSLPELLTELISDESARTDLFRRTGMTPPTEPS